MMQNSPPNTLAWAHIVKGAAVKWRNSGGLYLAMSEGGGV